MSGADAAKLIVAGLSCGLVAVILWIFWGTGGTGEGDKR